MGVLGQDLGRGKRDRATTPRGVQHNEQHMLIDPRR